MDSFQKGEKGELEVADKISFLGYKVIHIGGATKYAIDGGKFFSGDLFVFGNGKAFIVQVKYKEPRIKYPDTGLELYRFKTLKWLQEESGQSVLLIFTELSNKIYGEWVDKLKIEKHGGELNTKTNEEMIYFWLKDLKPLHELI